MSDLGTSCRSGYGPILSPDLRARSLAIHYVSAHATLMNFLKSHPRLIIWTIVLLSIPAAWYCKNLYDFRGHYAQEILQVQNLNLMATLRDTEAKRLEYEYTHNTIGSSTPEGTWELFLADLKDGTHDDRIYKYFIPQKQEQMKEEIAEARKKNSYEQFLKDVSLMRVDAGTLSDDNNMYHITHFDKNDLLIYSTHLKRNIFTNPPIWNIESF
jgi:hypothetical protein